MNAIQRLLTEHIDIWTAADTGKKSGRGRASGNTGRVYGIKKLRELILELAVRGKLVPQDAEDEPAIELLKRIRAEKAKLIAASKIRKDPPLPQIGPSEIPFALPQGWEWVRFGNALISRDAERIPISSDDRQFQKGEYDYYGASGVIDKIDKYLFEKPLLLIGEDGANLINRSTPIAFIARGKYWVNNHAHVLDGISEEFLRYVELCINAIDLTPYVTGTAQPKMNQAKMNGIVFGLPSETEQRRILAKVDELMALCDQLETQHTNAADAHEKLVSHLLGTLTQSQNAEDFSANWQRIAAHFDTLFTTEASIDALQQTLLQLAVMGKLAPQDPNDEPASELLKRHKISGAASFSPGWSKVSLGALGDIFGGATPSKAKSEYWLGEIPWVSPKDMKRLYINDAEDKVSEGAVLETSLKLIPSGSLLMVVRGMILAHSFPVALTTSAVTINQDMKALVVPEEIQEYLLLYLRAMKNFFVALVDRSSHGTCKLISEKLWAAIVEIPPLAEQQRIVEKVVELMVLCDQLKSRITNATQLQTKLADVLAEQAVATTNNPPPIST